MFRGILNAIKWGVMGVATGQLISGYKKEKTFKTEIDNAEGFDKLKVAGKYLFKTNKKLIEETDLEAMVEGVKTTTTQAKKQVQDIKPGQIIENVKTQAKQTWDDVMVMLKDKLVTIEEELMTFEQNAKGYAEDKRTEYYRQIASKFALFKKTVSKYVLEGAIAAEEQLELESKLDYLSDRLEKLKKSK